MKLYNLYESVILENISKLIQLNEAVSTSDIDNILNGDPVKKGKFYYVDFKYVSDDGTISRRWVQIFQRNMSTANNGLIDAFQVSRDGQTSEPSNERGSYTGWKKFNLDRIMELKVSKVPYFKEPNTYISGYRADGSAIIAKLNKTGNNSPSVSSTQKIAPIGTYQYAATTLANKERQQQKTKKAEEERLQQQKQNFGNRQPATQTTKPEQQPVQQSTNLDNKENEEELNNL